MNKLKKGLIVGSSAVGTVLMSVPCFAADSTVATTLATSLGTVATEFSSTVASVAPIGVTIAGTFLVWKLGLRFFKSIAK